VVYVVAVAPKKKKKNRRRRREDDSPYIKRSGNNKRYGCQHACMHARYGAKINDADNSAAYAHRLRTRVNDNTLFDGKIITPLPIQPLPV